MNYLIDTNILIWFFNNDPQLPTSFKSIIEDETNVIYVSVASIWEICIKNSIGKLDLSKPFEEIFPDYLERHSFEILQINVFHLQKLNKLQFYHNDPFDRIIVSQVLTENVEFLYTDEFLKKYME
ncbi:MAG: type II toxin-antitoxin system VapC family toxin [Leptospiraceae bacterium]|nr:type II toxin-antitoxin system VapC family toxin [Leptospiraceae bacterium]